MTHHRGPAATTEHRYTLIEERWFCTPMRLSAGADGVRDAYVGIGLLTLFMVVVTLLVAL